MVFSSCVFFYFHNRAGVGKACHHAYHNRQAEFFGKGEPVGTHVICFLLVGFQIVATTYFQSIGKVGTSIFLSLVRQVIFLLPLLMILPRFFGLDGIWFTFPVSDAMATIVSAILVVRSLNSLRDDTIFANA